MNVKISVFVIFVEAIIYFLLYNLHDCTFNFEKYYCKDTTELRKELRKEVKKHREGGKTTFSN